jgi:hypothetical protein
MKARVETLAGQDLSPAEPVDLSERQRTGRPEQR